MIKHNKANKEIVRFRNNFINNKKRILSSKFLHISRLLPNIITIMAICFGTSAIRFALDEKWEISVTLVLIAGFFDMADGKVARLLNASSNFGAHLDSLADFVNFGITPAIVLYLWGLHLISFRGLGWAFSLFFIICMAIRLARFNAELDDKNRPAWKDSFFVGVPAPAGAYLIALPLMLRFQFGVSIIPEFVGFYIVTIGFLMISRIPTFSAKKVVIKRENTPMILMSIGLIIILLLIEPWLILIFIAIIYIIMIPVSIRSFKRMSIKASSE